MKRIILLLIVGLFTLNINAQVKKTEPLKISKESLIANVNVINKTKYEIVSFDMSATVNGYEQEKRSYSNKLTSSQKNMIKKLKKGQKIYFTNIKAKDEEGTVKKIHSIVVILK